MSKRPGILRALLTRVFAKKGVPAERPTDDTSVVISRVQTASRTKRLAKKGEPTAPPPGAAIVMSTRPQLIGAEPGPDCLVLECSDAGYEHPMAMTRSQAEEAVEFFRGHQGCDVLLVACDDGRSRAPAMAAALLRSLGKDDGFIWDNPVFRPNPWVFTRMAEALGLPLAQGEVDGLVKRNEEAFRKAMGRGSDEAPRLE